MRKPFFIISTLLLLVALAGCSSRYTAPVDQIGDGPRFLDDGKQHLVNDGETLYAIAWMYDLDVNALARANNLPPPYTVERGMMLTVAPRAVNGGAGSAGTQSQVAAVQPSTAVATAVPLGGGLQRTPLKTAPLPGTPLPPAPRAEDITPTAEPATPAISTAPVRSAAEPAAAVAVAPRIEPAPTPAPTVVAPAPTPTQGEFAGNAAITWDWPYRGNIVGRFTDTGVVGKGLDLAGNPGDTVMAAADGEVVYAGGGLLRYGNLLILKHNEHFLSAYAHNRALLVKEGDVVKRGQQIAELGNSGIDRNMLHFEIRQDGQPVDPLSYLPAL